MNVAMHRADRGTLQRAIRDFGSRIVAEGKQDLVGLMSPSDLDEVSDKIIGKASNAFLDKALVARLRTIEARRLVNALARAERLGYDAADLVENEHVIPSLPGPVPMASYQHPATAPAQPLTPAPAQKAAPTAPAAGIVPRCESCQRTFPGLSAYTHVSFAFTEEDNQTNGSQHVKKKICAKPPTPNGPSGEIFICSHCGQYFAGISGLQYHMTNKVCGDFGTVIKENITSTILPLGLNPPTKRPAPDSNAIDLSSGSNSPAPQHGSVLPSSTQTPRSAPSSATPRSTQDVPLGTPQAKDMAHLTAHQIQALQGELRMAEEQFKAKIDDAQRSSSDMDEVQKKVTSLKNSFACKQSTIRKKYGIKLRQRRGRGEMEVERVRMGIPEGISRATPTGDKHVDKRARLGGDGDAAKTKAAPQETPTKRVAVADMGSGLTGSNATAATTDPTSGTSQAPKASSQAGSDRPSSSYQQGNYRVEVHLPSPSKKLQSSAPDGTTPGTNTPPIPSSGGTMTAKDLLRQMTGNTTTSGGDDEEAGSDSDSDSGSSTEGDGDE